MSEHAPNKLQSSLMRLDEAPAFMRGFVQNIILRRAVPFTGTAGVKFVSLMPERVEVHLANERRVQNHIGGVHASAMNLLAETATGMVVGMNVRDDCLPLAKELSMAFKKRATGGLKAVATLTAEQRAAMLASDKGEVQVKVPVTDEAGVEPVECVFTWAWVPSSRPPKNRRSFTMAQKQVQDAYFVAATRTPIGRSGRGYFKNTRPDDLLVAAIKSAMLQVPTLDPKAIEDAIIGCSFPEGEQGMNMARIAVGLAFDHPVGGVTVNRFCASGITALQMAADRIRVGEADVLIAGGAESMSLVPMGGNK